MLDFGRNFNGVFFGGSCRVTLVVAFGFVPKFWKVEGTYKCYFVSL